MTRWLRRRRTLRGRVSGLAIAVIAGWLLLLAGGFDLVLSTRVDQQIDDELRVRAQAASATLELRAGQIVGVRESATDSELDSSIWFYAGDRALERPHLSAAVQRAADALAQTDMHYADAANRRFYVLPVRSHGRAIGSIVAAIDTAPYAKTKQTAIVGSIVVAVLLLGGAYPVLRLAAARALLPVAQMTRQAAEWSVTAPMQRFGGRQQYAELSSLGVTLDELLDRLAAVLRHERQLSAELSHELRTPLSRVTAEVDLLLGRPDGVDREALQAIRDTCTAMDAIIDTLLSAARSELRHPVGHTELAAVLQAVADPAGEPAVIVAPTELRVGVDPAVVIRILTAIIDNARRYAASEITLRARRHIQGVAVEIVNDGVRLPAELADLVFEPGFSTGRRDGHDGAGLGLALARRLARATDGELSVDAGADRTTFVLRLPAG